MYLSPTDRATLLALFPDLASPGLSGTDLDHAVDAWYARDHYDNNPLVTATTLDLDF
jgi:hypothetical protein